jgi:ABC-2 type transport system permease protein
LQGDVASATPEASKDEKGKDKDKETSKARKINVIAIADLDLISEQFFQIRRQKVEDLELDNVTFVLNCVDVLAGDDSFVALRKRRLKHRTLETLEARTKTFVDAYLARSKEAEDEAKAKLDVAQKNLNKQVDAVRARTDVDERTKEILLLNLQEVANRRLDVEKANIEDVKRRAIQNSVGERENSVRNIRNNVRTLAVVIPPLPPLVLGILVFFVRMRRENVGATPSRLA